MEPQTELFLVETIFHSDFYHHLFSFSFHQLLLKVVLVQVERFILLLVEFKLTLDHLLTSQSFPFTFLVPLLFLGLLILLLLFLIDALQVFSDTNFLFLFDLYLLLLFSYFFLFQYLQVLLLDCLQTVTLILLSMIQRQVEIQSFINISSDFLVIQKFIFLFFQLLVLSAKSFLLTQESLFLVI